MLNEAAFSQQEHILSVEDDSGRREVILSLPVYVIGRSPDCDIILQSQFASRHHATLHRQQSEGGSSYYRIVDGDRKGKPSANGLLVNGRKVSAKDLKHGDSITFGSQVVATYQFRQRDEFSPSLSYDPFDITLIDPAMILEEDGENIHLE